MILSHHHNTKERGCTYGMFAEVVEALGTHTDACGVHTSKSQHFPLQVMCGCDGSTKALDFVSRFGRERGSLQPRKSTRKVVICNASSVSWSICAFPSLTDGPSTAVDGCALVASGGRASAWASADARIPFERACPAWCPASGGDDVRSSVLRAAITSRRSACARAHVRGNPSTPSSSAQRWCQWCVG
jgi:hypothetical protein